MLNDHVAVRVYAKINLFLRIIGKRNDGFHDIDTLMHPISVSDDIVVNPGNNGFTISCNDPEFPQHDNTVARAYLLLKERFPEKVGSCAVTVKKDIPTQAGLGGASADAAGALVAFNRCFDLSLADADLGKFAAAIGSDVAFFLSGAPAICRGRGEILRPLKGQLEGPVGLAISKNGVSTKEAYLKFSGTSNTEGMTSEMIAKLVSEGDISGVSRKLYNTFERLVFPERPDLEQTRDAFLDCGAEGSLMTGTGATVFALGIDEEKMQCARKRIESNTRRTVLTALRQNTYEWLS